MSTCELRRHFVYVYARRWLGPLSYTILLEEALAEKKCRQKHGGFWPEMTPLPWLLVPPAHANTTDQAQFEPATVQTPPPGFSENIY